MRNRTVTREDVVWGYRIILGRDPESSIDLNRTYRDQELRRFLDGLLASYEFRLGFLSIDPADGAADHGLAKDLTSEAADWLGQIGLSRKTLDRLSNADTLFEAVDLIVRERSQADPASNALLVKYVDEHPTPALAVQRSSRVELTALKLPHFPVAFDWRAYLQRRGAPGRGKWRALRMLLAAVPQAQALPPLEETVDVAGFLSALALHALGVNDAYAEMVLESVRRRRPLKASELVGLGEIALRRGAPVTALRSFLDARNLKPLGAAAAVQAIHAATSSQDLHTARALLGETREKLRGMPGWRAQLHAFYELRMHLAADVAYSRYRDQDRQGGDAALHRVCAKIKRDMDEMEPLGAPIPAEPTRRVVFLAETGLSQCSFYRVEPKLRLLPQLGIQCELVSLDDVEHVIDRLVGAECLLVYRMPAWPTVMRIISYARSLGVAVLFEIDDLLFDSQEYPDSLESYGGLVDVQEYTNLLLGVPLFAETARMSDAAIASTRPLADRLSGYVRLGKAQLLVNSLGPRLCNVARPPPRPDDDIVTILYGTGTRAHNSDFSELVAPALQNLFVEHADVRLVVVGHLTLPDILLPYRNKVVEYGFFQSQEQYWALLSRADINIAVLHASPMADCKSEIKWLEAARFEVASIVSPTATYRQALTDGENVLFAADAAGWEAALRRLVERPEDRRRIGRAASDLAGRDYSQAVALTQMSKALQMVPSSKYLDSKKKRLMLVAVFFPPHVFGGATRVLKDNVDHFLDNGLLEEFDVCIVASDHDVLPEGRLRVDAYRGIPVFRISVPQHENMDWRPDNPVIGAVFARVHDLWRPDLVHFHCIQRLTGSCVDVCRMSRTPYIITAHDAWWISDHQFLIDQDGEVVNTDLGIERHRPPTGVTEAAALQRSIYLRSLLGDAKLVLGVSETFTDLYRRAGADNMQTVANGVPAWRTVARKEPEDGRVHLAHVGNTTAHKGLPLVRQALVNNRFGNLMLTVIDHAKDEGYLHEEIWGATPVRLIGPLAQADMPEFYARQHVLLAPSLWPESFGLVTREALISGLWVVASDRGAIAEDVTPGNNGFVVDVSSPEALTLALAQIDSRPDVYTRSPPVMRMRASSDQARELENLYRSIACCAKEPRPFSAAQLGGAQPGAR